VNSYDFVSSRRANRGLGLLQCDRGPAYPANRAQGPLKTKCILHEYNILYINHFTLHKTDLVLDIWITILTNLTSPTVADTTSEYFGYIRHCLLAVTLLSLHGEIPRSYHVHAEPCDVSKSQKMRSKSDDISWNLTRTSWLWLLGFVQLFQSPELDTTYRRSPPDNRPGHTRWHCQHCRRPRRPGHKTHQGGHKT